MERVPPFHRRVYEVARTIPPGATLSYGDIAARLGSPGAARAVGQALGRNPFAIVRAVPPRARRRRQGRRVFGQRRRRRPSFAMLAIEGAPGRWAARRALFDGDGAFGFDAAGAVEHLRAADPTLARVIDAVGPFRMQLDAKPERLSGAGRGHRLPAAHRQGGGDDLRARARALPARARTAPPPAQLLRASDEQLRAAGLSRAKLLALRDLARRAADGEIPTLAEAHRMEDEAIIERLTEVRGIGRWTVEMFLMFRLGRPDVLPADDYGIRKGFARGLRQARAARAPGSREARRALEAVSHGGQLVPVARAGAGEKAAGEQTRRRRHGALVPGHSDIDRLELR